MQRLGGAVVALLVLWLVVSVAIAVWIAGDDADLNRSLKYTP